MADTDTLEIENTELRTEIDRLRAELAVAQERVQRLVDAIKPAIVDAEKAVNPEARLFNYGRIKREVCGEE